MKKSIQDKLCTFEEEYLQDFMKVLTVRFISKANIKRISSQMIDIQLYDFVYLLSTNNINLKKGIPRSL